MPASDQRVSLRRAAALIHKTASPSAQQIERVRGWIATGDLQGDARGTSAEAIADFLARVSRQRESRIVQRGETDESSLQLHKVYHQSLKTFFLAVIFQQRATNFSVAFRRAVLAAQISLLVLIAATVLFSARIAFPSLDPQRAAIVSWLNEHQPNHRILRWHKPTVDDDGRTLLRVEYNYVTPLGRGVDTVRTFVLAGNQVTGIDGGD